MQVIQIISGVLFLTAGIIMSGISIFGVFKFKYVLNRMHAAAIGDTAAFGLFTIGILILRGPSMISLKILLIWLLLWSGSAVASHMLCQMEYYTDEKGVAKNCVEEKEVE